MRIFWSAVGFLQCSAPPCLTLRVRQCREVVLAVVQETMSTQGGEGRESSNYHGWARSTNKSTAQSPWRIKHTPSYTELLCCLYGYRSCFFSEQHLLKETSLFPFANLCFWLSDCVSCLSRTRLHCIQYILLLTLLVGLKPLVNWSIIWLTENESAAILITD